MNLKRPFFSTHVFIFFLVTICGISPLTSQARKVLKPNQRVMTPVLSPRSDLQHATLSYIFYKNSPYPDAPTSQEIKDVKKQYAKLKLHEIDLLDEIYEENWPLLALATRDSDGDGIRDYSIDEYGRGASIGGRFFANDLDIDNDGIENFLDASPYDSSIGFEDQNSNGIPDHIDWSITSVTHQKSAQAASYQKKIFDRWGVFLVERSGDFNLKWATLVYHALTHLFSEPLASKKIAKSLKVIYLDERDGVNYSDYYAAVSSDGGMTLNAQTLSALDPFQQIVGVLYHELAHVYHYSLDYKTKVPTTSPGFQNVFEFPNYFKFLKNFGWDFQPGKADPKTFFELITPTYTDTNPYDIELNGQTEKEWKERIEIDQQDLNHDDYHHAHIISPYSVTDPLEWFAELSAARLYNQVEFELEQMVDSKKAQSVMKKIDEKLIDEFSFHRKNAFSYGTNDVLPDELESRLPLNSRSVRHLIRQYLL